MNMYEISSNATVRFSTLFYLAEKEVIDWFEIYISKNIFSVPAFKVMKDYKEYVIEVNLKTYGIYDHDDYYCGVGLPLREGNTTEVISNFFKELV